MPRTVPTFLLALAMVPCLLGCPQTTDDDSAAAADDDVFDPSLYEVIEPELTVADGEAYRGTDDAEIVFHAQRFWLDSPMRIVAIGAMFNVRSDDSLPADIALYPDEGHNFYDFLREAPVAEWNPVLGKDAHDEVWQVFPLPEPHDVAWPKLVYVGSRYGGVPGQPVLATDEDVSVDQFLLAHAGENDQYPPHVAVLPDRGTDAYGFETVYFAGTQGPMAMMGDLMVRLYVERYGVVEQTWFRDASDEGTGLSSSGAVSFGDCNADGWIDVWDGRLMVNDGDCTFSDMTAVSGIAAGGNALWGDYDNDGILDLFMATTDDRLYHGLGNCTFEDATAASGIDDTQVFSSDAAVGPVLQHLPTVASAWMDFDGDGLLDLMQPGWGSFDTEDYGLDYLWHNEGGGVFRNVTAELGMVTMQGAGKAGRTVATSDWDGDGDMDAYVGNYRLQRNLAYLNEGDHFSDGGSGNPLEGDPYEYGPLQYYYGHTIGVAWGDIDNDGDSDLFAANLAHPRFISFSDKSMMLRNALAETGTATFVDVRDEVGMIYQETDSSPIFDDFDDDGWLDLFYTTVYPARPSYLYTNDGDGTFTMHSYEAGTWIYGGWGVSSADIDGDGDRDIYGGRLLINEHPAPGGSVQISAIGSGTGATNVSGIGAVVSLTTAAGTQTREVVAGVGVGCQQPLEQHFGLGGAATATVQVWFPVTETMVDAGTVVPGDRIAVYEDGTVLDR